MVKEDRKKYHIRGPCKKSTIDCQKEAGIEGACLFIYRHIPNKKTTQSDGTRNTGDNDANKVFITNNDYNTNMMATDFVPVKDKYTISCPRCQHIVQRAQRPVPQIPNVEGYCSKNICIHCQAQIKDQLKPESKTLRRRHIEEQLEDSEITKLKDESLSTIRRETQKSIPPKKEPLITPLISSLTLDDERLSDAETRIRKVSIKGTIEVIQEPRHGGIFLDDNSDSKIFLPPKHDDIFLGDKSDSKIFLPPKHDDMFFDEESGMYLKIKQGLDKRLFETKTKALRRPRKLTTNIKPFSHIKPHHEKEYLDHQLSINSLMSKLSEAPKNFLKGDFQFHFPKRAKKKFGESRKGDKILGTTDSVSRLHMKAEEKKTKSEKDKKRQVRLEKREKTSKEGVLDSSLLSSLKGKSNISKISGTTESEPSKTDESLHKGKKRVKDSRFYESKEDFGKGKRGKKSEEDEYNKKRDKGQKETDVEKEDKEHQYQKEKVRVKKDKEKPIPKILEKDLQASGIEEKKTDKGKVLTAHGKDKNKTDKDKALLANGKALPALGKDEKISGKDKALSTPGKDKKISEADKKLSAPGTQLPAASGKDKEILDNEKALSAREKGLQDREEERDDKSGEKKILPASGKELLNVEKHEKSAEEKKWYLPPGKDEEKNEKGKTLPAVGIRLPVSVPIREKGLQDHEKENKDKSDKEKKKKISDAKTKPAADDTTLGGKGSPKKEKHDMVDKNYIKVVPSTDKMLSNLISQMKPRENLPKMPTPVTIPKLPTRKPRRMKQEKVETSDSFEPEPDRDFIESEEGSLPVDEVVFETKIINKHRIPIARELTETKQRTADIVYNNIFKDDLFQPIEEMPQSTKKDKSNEKTILAKDMPTDGILRYALSDRTFIEKGWTMLPIEKVVCKTNVYRMRPAHPEFNWFEHNKAKGAMYYDSGEKLAEFKDNHLGQWFYRNGRLALNYYDAEDTNAQQRIVIYSNGELDERGRSRPITILGMFDYVGNGVIFDHKGKIRLKYNQTEGVVLDREIGPVSHWKWHSLNDPPVLQQVMIDTQMLLKDPRIVQLGMGLDKRSPEINKDMVAIEFENAIKEKSQKMNEKFKPFQIKMKALKINENFSIRILDQASIYLLFRDGTTNLKLNLGMLLDSREIIDTDTEDLGEISTGIERLPAKTDSLATLQHNIKYAQHFERNRTERDQRLRLPEPVASADRFNTLVSKPLNPPLRAVNCVTAISGESERCYSRKPSICTLYYNNRLN